MGTDSGATEIGWGAWVTAHAARLLLYARQQTRCEADAQDVVQESMVEAWRRRPQGELPELPLVFATIRRRAIDLGRREDRRVQREQASQGARSVEWFDSTLEDRELSGMIQSALRNLVPEQREVITLKVWGGLTFAEIGEALEISANTAASRYRYALARLKRVTQEVLV
jgi:RNA polymerase sigma-70 factor (ECF subfamily)